MCCCIFVSACLWAPDITALVYFSFISWKLIFSHYFCHPDEHRSDSNQFQISWLGLRSGLRGASPPNLNWLFEFVDCSPKITETSSIWMCSNLLANTTLNHKDCVPPLWGHMSIAKCPKLCSHCEFIIQRHPHRWDSEPLAWRRRSLLRNTLHLGRSPPLLQARGSVIKPNLRARCCFLAFAEANDCFPLDATVSPWKHCDEKKPTW